MTGQVALVITGIRLVFEGRGTSLRRFAFLVVGVALGVTVLLALAAVSRVSDLRYKRLIARGEVPLQVHAALSGTAPATLLRTTVRHNINGQTLVFIALGAEGIDPLLPPGVPRLPAAGEVFVSPALWAALQRVDRTSANLHLLLGEEIAGQLEKDALLAPNEWVAVVGYDPIVLRTSGVTQTITQPFQVDTLQDHSHSRNQPLLWMIGLGLLVGPCASSKGLTRRPPVGKGCRRNATPSPTGG